ncbi:hypothetical protein CBR_g41159 [Chara braunii]|uniref:Secreted protein n=1 Tax=Chara braunii TaxID=69332 RepID=A0A388K2G2_CHABU|nr:hypothetical protein CBR_g41159 [Chara braunii]|eukprot:GBG64238.1 hypothetical protein CBR_g41159 [Chara braunii]
MALVTAAIVLCACLRRLLVLAGKALRKGIHEVDAGFGGNGGRRGRKVALAGKAGDKGRLTRAAGAFGGKGMEPEPPWRF